MTAIMDEIRRLEAAHARGDLTAVQLQAAKAALVSDIEDANDTKAQLPDEGKPELPKSALFDIVLFCVLATVACIVIATLLFGDLTLAITLAATLLAAFTVRAFVALDD